MLRMALGIVRWAAQEVDVHGCREPVRIANRSYCG
jgi:hypothetical protein